MDIILSSGFLAFSRHCGFLRAVEEAPFEVDGICGTSSGALAGALWAAGLPAQKVAEVLAAERPLAALGWSWRPWRGLFSLQPMARRLGELLPASFSDLEVPFGVGVKTADGGHRVLTQGDLVAAVIASCAMPFLFAPVEIAGARYADGGAVDRLGLITWRGLRGDDRPIAVHLVERSHGAKAEDDLGTVTVVRSARSGASFWDLGPFAAQMEESYQNARAIFSVSD